MTTEKDSGAFVKALKTWMTWWLVTETPVPFSGSTSVVWDWSRQHQKVSHGFAPPVHFETLEPKCVFVLQLINSVLVFYLLHCWPCFWYLKFTLLTALLHLTPVRTICDQGFKFTSRNTLRSSRYFVVHSFTVFKKLIHYQKWLLKLIEKKVHKTIRKSKTKSR